MTELYFKNWYDGKTGYEIVNGEKGKADLKEFKDKKYKKNIFNEFDFIDPTLWTLELLEEEKVNNENCYKLRATLRNGEERNLYFSKSSFYMLRKTKYQIQRRTVSVQYIFLTIKNLEDLLFTR